MGGARANKHPMRVLLPLVALTICLGPSCAHHVVLDRPPPPSAPLEHRSAWYQDHALTKPERGELVVRARLFGEHPTVTRRRGALNNGTPIERVEDLRPLVLEGSSSAAAMDRAVAARARADALVGAGAAALGLGLGLAATLVAIDLGVWPGSAQVPAQQQIAPPLVVAGIGSAVGGALVGGVLVTLGTMARDQEDDATTAAFRGFNADLRARLALDEPR